MEYDVTLNSGAEVDFNASGEWREVKAASGKAVPAAIVPAAISTYVKTNHKGKSISKISFKRGGYQLKLSDGSELKLTKEGKPFEGGKGQGREGQRKSGAKNK